jgi:hypothetical protein
MAAAAGAMLYVVVEELIPETVRTIGAQYGSGFDVAGLVRLDPGAFSIGRQDAKRAGRTAGVDQPYRVAVHELPKPGLRHRHDASAGVGDGRGCSSANNQTRAGSMTLPYGSRCGRNFTTSGPGSSGPVRTFGPARSIRIRQDRPCRSPPAEGARSSAPTRRQSHARS